MPKRKPTYLCLTKDQIEELQTLEKRIVALADKNEEGTLFAQVYPSMGYITVQLVDHSTAIKMIAVLTAQGYLKEEQ